jgi:LuxR family transcriptional regulator/LuxR family quorum-sensing system transcriptional regulator CciR
MGAVGMRLRDVEAGIEGAESGEALWAVFSGYFRGTEVDRVSYLHLPPLGAPDVRRPRLKAEGFPEELVARYIEERHYRDNPVVAAARERLEPVYWEDAIATAGLSARERAFVDMYRGAALGSGVAIPVYGPNSRDGQCGLGFIPGVRRLVPEVLREFQWVCQLAHLRYCAIVIATLGPPPRLSGREVEVLGWVACGKSNSLIGDILGISAHTVDAHMRRICLKLGVSDRISAAVRGIGVGLIHAAS